MKAGVYSVFTIGVSRAIGSPSGAKEIAEKPGFRCTAPKGASQFKELATLLKRCPDTKLEFFSNLKASIFIGTERHG
ncbi:MAG TPA: hypothetical protein VK302_04470 [Terriglobales bacterium]|nr:hypothetical protein [Terriglobales bacterium]